MAEKEEKTEKKAEKKVLKKSSKEKVKKPGRKLSALYTMAGEGIKRMNKFCPKCGPGTFMGRHKDRAVCGHCNYTEFGKREE